MADITNALQPSCKFTCPASGCFPGTGKVELEGGSTKQIVDLKVGDKVRVSPSEFSEVYFFSTNMREVQSKNVKLTTASAEISLTSNHFLYVNGKLELARDVKVGDSVVLANGTKAEVTAVGQEWGEGLFNPHTMHGDIVVDGIHASTYTDAVHPKLAHALLSPLRTMYTAGLSFGAEFEGAVKGLPTWVLNAIGA